VLELHLDTLATFNKIMQTLQAKSLGKPLCYRRQVVAVSKRLSVRVQAVAATANGKTVLAPPYNVLITGSTKGVLAVCTQLLQRTGSKVCWGLDYLHSICIQSMSHRPSCAACVPRAPIVCRQHSSVNVLDIASCA
jgi:hypothetical protein